jgi:putative transposase
MARRPRLFLPGIPQHVVSRGVDKRAVFFAPGDYREYLDSLHDAARKHDCAIHAYVLMTNHVHLLVTPANEQSLPLTMQALGPSYVQPLNRRYSRTGTLWEGRYRACLVQSDAYFLTCQRYIELNPVRAQIVGDPGDYPYSSYAHYAYGSADRLVTPHACYLALHRDASSRPRAYRELFSHVLTKKQIDSIRRQTRLSTYLGDDLFRQQIEAMLGRRLSPRKPGRRPSRKIQRNSAPTPIGRPKK